MAALQSAQVFDLRAHFGEAFLPAPASGHHDLARGSQPQASGQAFEQWHADLCLDIEDLAIDRGSRYVEFVCGLADRAEPADSNEIAQETGKRGHGYDLLWTYLIFATLRPIHCICTKQVKVITTQACS